MMPSDFAVQSSTPASVPSPLRVVVMGVSGCGKTTIAERLSAALQWAYIEGDQHHPQANIAKMSAGIPLTDADRAGWLDVLAGHLAHSTQLQQGLILTCSALKRRYRDRLRQADPALCFIHLTGTAEEIQPRLALRTGHYMPASLLDSQFRDLEPPSDQERAMPIAVTQPPEWIVNQALAHLRALDANLCASAPSTQLARSP